MLTVFVWDSLSSIRYNLLSKTTTIVVRDLGEKMIQTSLLGHALAALLCCLGFFQTLTGCKDRTSGTSAVKDTAEVDQFLILWFKSLDFANRESRAPVEKSWGMIVDDREIHLSDERPNWVKIFPTIIHNFTEYNEWYVNLAKQLKSHVIKWDDINVIAWSPTAVRVSWTETFYVQPDLIAGVTTPIPLTQTFKTTAVLIRGVDGKLRIQQYIVANKEVR